MTASQLSSDSPIEPTTQKFDSQKSDNKAVSMAYVSTSPVPPITPSTTVHTPPIVPPIMTPLYKRSLQSSVDPPDNLLQDSSIGTSSVPEYPSLSCGPEILDMPRPPMPPRDNQPTSSSHSQQSQQSTPQKRGDPLHTFSQPLTPTPTPLLAACTSLPVYTPRDAICTSETLPFSAILELRRQLKDAKSASQDSIVSIGMQMADGLHGALIDHAKLRESRRELQADKRALEDKVRLLRKRLSAKDSIHTTSYTEGSAQWEIPANMEGGWAQGTESRRERAMPRGTYATMSTDALTVKSDDITAVDVESLRSGDTARPVQHAKDHQIRQLMHHNTELEARVIELENSIQDKDEKLSLLQQSIDRLSKGEPLSQAATMSTGASSWLATMSNNMSTISARLAASKVPAPLPSCSMAGEHVDDEVMGKLVHAKMRIAVIEEELDTLRGDVVKAQRDKAASQAETQSMHDVVAELQAKLEKYESAPTSPPEATEESKSEQQSNFDAHVHTLSKPDQSHTVTEEPHASSPASGPVPEQSSPVDDLNPFEKD